jgi:hypothetical protein
MDASYKFEIDICLALDTSFSYHGKHAIRVLCVFENIDVLVVQVKEGVFQLVMSNWQ